MSDILIYQTEDGRTQVNLLVQEHTVWLNQSQLAELFDTSVPNIATHIKNILEDKELDEDSVIKDFLITAADGKQYQVKHYGRQRHVQPQTNGSVETVVSGSLEMDLPPSTGYLGYFEKRMNL